jgi:dGTPase
MVPPEYEMCQLFDERSIYTNPNAMLGINSRGRKRCLKTDNYRTEYQRDIHRIIYSRPFRRLRHKTQVFFLPNNDHICTRMEHVLHVASASRTVARHLRLNEDLAEAIGLGHDIGHSPFGHQGEHVLNKICKENGLDISFQHEINGLRVVDRLAEFDRDPEPGLNLTYEVRDGIMSHCGEDFSTNPIIPEKNVKILEDIKSRKDALMPCTFEGCIVRIVDKIAYAGRDIEDALITGLFSEKDVPGDLIRELGRNNGEIIGSLLRDLIQTDMENENGIGLSQEKFEALKELINFNYRMIYNNEDVEKYKIQAEWAIRQLFNHLLEQIKKTNRFEEKYPKIPIFEEFKRYIGKVGYSNDEKDEIIVLDFIAGMTDNYVIECINELFMPKAII